MKRYKYRMVGRIDGSLEQIFYEGQVEAVNAKEAFLAALADKFGSSSRKGQGFKNQLYGWIGREELDLQYDDLDEVECENANLCLRNDNKEYIIEVTEIDKGSAIQV